MKPSQTQLGQMWTDTFNEEDRDGVRSLIDSLDIHDHAEIMSSLAQELRDLAINAPSACPIMLVPIRSLEDLPAIEDDAEGYVAFQNFDPGLGFPALPGSEAEVAGIIRDLVNNSNGRFLSPETSLGELKVLKARTICLVTDYCGSGTQASRFAKMFTDNRTIASWMSYGRIKVHVISYASSVDAIELFRTNKHVSFQTCTIAKSANSASWSDAGRERIEKLCMDYAGTDNLNTVFGYGDSFGLYLSNLRVPNNLPKILIDDSESSPGLFYGRQVPNSFFHELPSYRSPHSVGTFLRNLGASGLADQLEEGTRPVKGLKAIAALCLIENGIAEERAYIMLASDEESRKQLRTTLLALGCLTLEGKLTKRGRTELRRAEYRRAEYKRSGRPKYQHMSKSPVSYKPTQLR